MLVEDRVYFADPTTFNDPLDTKPTLNSDLENEALKQALRQLFEQRTRAEMDVAAQTIKYRGPKTIAHIERKSQQAAENLLADIEYNSTNPEYEYEDPEKVLLSFYVERELLLRYDKGIFSLAKRANCPLMWSHYGDQHKGLCVGYSVPAEAAKDLHKVQYGGSRLVNASDVSDMLRGDEASRRKVDEAVLLKKAKPWGYEKEWRLIGPRGLQDSPLILEEVVFGMRCTDAVKFAVVRALEDRDISVQFYEICQNPGSFILTKRQLNTDELVAELPRRSRHWENPFEKFSSITTV